MNINFHIDRLILEGFPITHTQGVLVQRTVEGELVCLLAEGGLVSNWQAGGAVRSVRADAIQLTSQTTPTDLGQQIAQAVYRGIRKAT